MIRSTLCSLVISCMLISCTSTAKNETKAETNSPDSTFNDLGDDIISNPDNEIDDSNITPKSITLEKGGGLPDGIIEHSCIKKDEYPKEKSTSLKFINTDKRLAKIGDGRIELTCRDTIIIFEDMPEDEYGYYATFKYIGKINILNSFLVLGEGLETSNYSLIDATTGETSLYFNYILFSPDGKRMIIGEHQTVDSKIFDLNLYNIDKYKFKKMATIEYDGWYPAKYNDFQEMIWDFTDNIYMSMVHFPYRAEEQPTYLKLEIDWKKVNIYANQ